MSAAVPTEAAPLPIDVRLMNAASVLLAALAVAAALGAVGAWLLSSPSFAIGSIRVEGDVERNTAATIRANTRGKLEGSFFTLDLQQARRAFESTPWVRSAEVRRIWPNRLVVRLEEHRAAALWKGTDGVLRLLNTRGEVFDANAGDVDAAALPILSGPLSESARVLAMHRELEPVFAPLAARIRKLALSGRGSWRAELQSGAVVELGRAVDHDEEVVARATRFVRTLPELTARYQRPLVAADLRHREGYAVRLLGVATTHEPQKASGRN